MKCFKITGAILSLLLLVVSSNAMAMGSGQSGKPGDVKPGVDSWPLHCDPSDNNPSQAEEHGDFADALVISARQAAIKNGAIQVSFKLAAGFCEKNEQGIYKNWRYENAVKGDVARLRRWKGTGSAVEFKSGIQGVTGNAGFSVQLSELLNGDELAAWKAGKAVPLALAVYYWMGPSLGKFDSSFRTHDTQYDHDEKRWLERNKVNFVWYIEVQGNKVTYKKKP
jgi:hypothetical protein